MSQTPLKDIGLREKFGTIGMLEVKADGPDHPLNPKVAALASSEAALRCFQRSAGNEHCGAATLHHAIAEVHCSELLIAFELGFSTAKAGDQVSKTHGPHIHRHAPFF